MIYSGNENQGVSNGATIANVVASAPINGNANGIHEATNGVNAHTNNIADDSDSEAESSSSSPVYYNARLDPKNFLEGPLSCNPATRLRQMLARPGIVVRIYHYPAILAV